MPWKESADGGVQPGIDTAATTSTASPPADRAAAAAVSEFEALLRANDRRLRALAYRMVGSDVDDVLQQAYLKAFLQRSTFRGDSSVATWLHRIVYTTALDHLRTADRRDRRDRLQLRSAGTDLVRDTSDDVVDRMALEAALDELPVDQRAVLVLVDAQGMSYDDAAAVLDVAPGTIASRLSRARSAVRARLTDGGAR
jgi:RNA polymerase sigma-70 factor (ECF subfamily)